MENMNKSTLKQQLIVLRVEISLKVLVVMGSHLGLIINIGILFSHFLNILISFNL